MFKTRFLQDSVNEDGEIVFEVYLTAAPSHQVKITANFDNTKWANANGSTNGSTQLIFQSDNFQKNKP